MGWIFLYLLKELKYTNSKQKILKEIHLCYAYAIFQKYFSVNNIKKTRLYREVYDYSVDYATTDVDDFLEIHKYLMEKNDVK